MFTARTALVDIVSGKQLGVLALPKMNVDENIIHDGWVWQVSVVYVYRGRQIVCVSRTSPANQDFLDTLTWE